MKVVQGTVVPGKTPATVGLITVTTTGVGVGLTGGVVMTTVGLVTVVGVVTVALVVLGAVVDEAAVASDLIAAAPGINTAWLLRLVPVGDVAVAVLVPPEPVADE